MSNFWEDKVMEMLLVKDKWDDYTIANDKGVEWAALDLLRQRVEDGFWYHDEAETKASEIVKHEDADMALRFLLNRRDHEYEWVEVTTPRRLS